MECKYCKNIFEPRIKNGSNMQKFCSQNCREKFWMKLNSKNPIWIVYHRLNSAKVARKRREFLLSQTSLECQKCGYYKCLKALEFHHINREEKDYDTNRLSYKLVLQIIEDFKKGKVRVLCANCHREEEEIIQQKKEEEYEQIWNGRKIRKLS